MQVKFFSGNFLRHSTSQSILSAILYSSSQASIVLMVDSLDRPLWMRDVSQSATEKVHLGI